MSTTTFPSTPVTSSRTRVWWALAAWLALALTAAASGLLETLLLRVPPPAFILGLVVLGIVLHARWSALREWARTVDLRVPILFHVVRLGFGSLFLVLSARGLLSPAFAEVAAPGDIAAGLLAVPAALLATRATPLARRGVLAWNVLGLLDMGLVMASAASLFFSPERMELLPLTRFPLGVLPTFVVPLVFLSHLLVFVRLRQAAQAPRAR